MSGALIPAGTGGMLRRIRKVAAKRDELIAKEQETGRMRSGVSSRRQDPSPIVLARSGRIGRLLAEPLRRRAVAVTERLLIVLGGIFFDSAVTSMPVDHSPAVDRWMYMFRALSRQVAT